MNSPPPPASPPCLSFSWPPPVVVQTWALGSQCPFVSQVVEFHWPARWTWWRLQSGGREGRSGGAVACGTLHSGGSNRPRGKHVSKEITALFHFYNYTTVDHKYKKRICSLRYWQSKNSRTDQVRLSLGYRIRWASRMYIYNNIYWCFFSYTN